MARFYGEPRGASRVLPAARVRLALAAEAERVRMVSGVFVAVNRTLR